ncbi:hypothetical protein MMC17_009836 [Xylographa soralifera]|nr:hypothetical protein [Xylographa soralifera]
MTMLRTSALLSLFLNYFILANATAFGSLNLTALYGPGLSPGAEIFYASYSNFTTDVTQRWNLHDAPTFYGAIRVATEGDIQHVIKVSVEHDIEFMGIGGGHGSISTLGRLKNGIEIDLGNFKSVNLDVENSTVTVGGAVVFSQLYEPLYNAGKMLPMGNARCVGLVGATLGATVGSFQGLFGLGLDSLLSVRLATANGDIVDASETQNADLFWGIRGAGANFGIVTSAVYRVHDAPNGGNVTSIDFEYPASANASLWGALKSYDDEMPNELVLNTVVSFNRTAEQAILGINAAYFGPVSEAQQYLAPFYDINPLATDINVVPWTELQDVAFFGLGAILGETSCDVGQYSNPFTVGAKQIDVPTFVTFFNELTAFFIQYPTYAGSLSIERIPNAVTLSVDDGQTAYAHREIKTQIIFENDYPNSTLDGPVDAFMHKARTDFQATSGFERLSTYVYFAHGDEGVDAWWAPRKMANLTQLKRIWDPNQVFSWNSPIPLHYP